MENNKNKYTYICTYTYLYLCVYTHAYTYVNKKANPPTNQNLMKNEHIHTGNRIAVTRQERLRRGRVSKFAWRWMKTKLLVVSFAVVYTKVKTCEMFCTVYNLCNGPNCYLNK